MPPGGNLASTKKGGAKGKQGKGDERRTITAADVQDNLGVLAENLCGNQSMAKTQLIMTRGEAAYYVWRQAIGTEGKRQEIGKKHHCIPWLLQLITASDDFTKHAAVGCLQFLAQSPDLKELIIQRGYGDKALGNIVRLLEGGHDRTRVRALALLYQVCQVPEIVLSLKDYLQPVVKMLGPCDANQWSGSEEGRAFAAGILRSFAHGDLNPDITGMVGDGSSMKALLIAEGVVKPLVELMATGTEMARTESVGLLAVLCEEEGVPFEILNLGGLPALVDILTNGQAEAKTHAAGVVQLTAVEPDYMEKIVEGGAIAPLCTLLKSVGELGAKRGRKKNVQLDPTTELALENATGAMRHLSFHDPSIAQLAAGGVIPTLVALLSSRNVQIFQNATGVLYNIALDGQYYEELVACRAPAYLTRPLHHRWLINTSLGAVPS